MSRSITGTTSSSSGKLTLDSPKIDDITASYTKTTSTDHKHNDEDANNVDIRNYLKRSSTSHTDTKANIDKSPQNSIDNNTTLHSNKSSPIPDTIGINEKPPHEIDTEIDKNSPRVKKLPLNFKYCHTDDLLVLVSRMLQSLLDINDQSQETISSSNLTRFHSRVPPNISVHSYLSRLTKFSNIENSILLSSIYYIDLLSNSYKSFTLNSLTVHRFLLTATTVGSKGLCDSFCTNYHYAKVGGVLHHELNLLEMDFLDNVSWRIVPQAIGENQKQSPINNNPFEKKLVSISKAHEILDMYYKQLINLTGSMNLITDDIYILGDEDHQSHNIRQEQQQSQRQKHIREDLVKLSPLKRSADPVIDKKKRSR